MSGDFTFLKGNIETIILCSLYNRDKYGYEIAKDIKDRTENAYEIKQPTLYSYLKRLQDDGLIDSYWGTESNGGRRRYYMLTKYGRQNCVKFISEWEFQRGVLSNLVDGTTDTTEEVSQEDVTPLFGRRSQRRKSRPAEEALQRQDDISSMLDQLDGGTSPDYETAADNAQENEVAATTVVQETEPYVEETADEDDRETQTVTAENQVIQRNDESVVTATADEQPEPPVDDGNPIPPQTSVEEARSRFEVHQDDADLFIKGFDRLAADATGRNQAATDNYQHVIMSVVGNQLDEVGQMQTAPQTFDNMDIEGRPIQLEQVADGFAQEGIRMRIYNHATATYKAKTLMPVSKVLMKSGWLTYLFAVIWFGLLVAVCAPLGTWIPFVITVAVIALAPIALSVVAFVDNGRRDKPEFAYRLMQTITLILAGIVALVSLSICLFNNIQLGKFVEVATGVLIPTGIAILPALFVYIYNYFYKKY